MCGLAARSDTSTIVTKDGSSPALRNLRLGAWVLWALSFSTALVAMGWTFQNGGTAHDVPVWVAWTVRTLSFPGWPVLHFVTAHSLSWTALAGPLGTSDEVFLAIAFVGGLAVGIVFWVGVVPECLIRVCRAASWTSRSQRS